MATDTIPELTPERRAMAIAWLEALVREDEKTMLVSTINALRAVVGFLRETADLHDQTPSVCPACASENWADVDTTDAEAVYLVEVATCGDCGAVTESLGMYYRWETTPAEDEDAS